MINRVLIRNVKNTTGLQSTLLQTTCVILKEILIPATK